MKRFALAVCGLFLCGCAHNSGGLFYGEEAYMGFKPENMSASISYRDGLAVADVSRENSAWDITVDSDTGLSLDKTTGSVKGIKRIKREVGPQITGYLVDLAKADPESARNYLKATEAYWKAVAKDKAEETATE